MNKHTCVGEISVEAICISLSNALYMALVAFNHLIGR